MPLPLPPTPHPLHPLPWPHAHPQQRPAHGEPVEGHTPPAAHAAGGGASDSTSFFCERIPLSETTPPRHEYGVIRKSDRIHRYLHPPPHGTRPSPPHLPPQRRKVWVQSLPRRRPGARPARLQLVSLCRFLPIFHPGRRPPFGPRPGRYDSFPFVDFFDTPQRGPRPPVRPVPGSYDLSPFVHLSVAPQTQAAPRPSRHGGAEKNACHYSVQIKPLRANGGMERP